MNKELAVLCAGGFSFFGITNRLISHKLRNRLAVISETSGLLNDIVELSAKDGNLDPGKLKSLTESIIEEISRANGLVGHMNAFAHSVDEFFTDVDISEALGLTVELARLDTYAKNAELLFLGAEDCKAYTSPFFLENLIYHAIVFSMNEAGSEEKITASIHPDAKGFRINFSGIAPDTTQQFANEEIRLLAKALSAKMSFDNSAGEIDIILPQTMSEGVLQSLAPNE